MVNLTEKAAILSFSNILMRLSTILSGIVVVRFLTQEQLGSLRQVILIFSTLSMVLLLGIPNSIYFFVPRAKTHEIRGILFQTYLTLFLIGGTSGVVLYLCAPLISYQFDNVELTYLIRRYSPYLAFILPGNSFFATMMSLNKVVRASVIRIGITIAQIGALLLPILLKCHLITVFTTMLVVNVIITIISLWYSLKISPEGSLSTAKGFRLEQIRFSLPLGMGQMASLLAKKVDQFFISIFFSVKQFAIYSVGALEIPINDFFASAIRTVLLPEFVKHFQENNIQKVASTWRESRRKLALLTFPIISLFLFVSPEFIVFVYGTQYIGAVVIFQIYLMIPLLSNLDSGVILHAKGKTKLLLYGMLLNFTSNIIFNYFLIHLLQEKGPPIATILAQLLEFWFIFIQLRKETKVSWSTLFPWRVYGRVLEACFVGGCSIIPLRLVKGLPDFYFLMLSGIIFSSIIGILYLLVILEKDELESLQKYLGRISIFNRFLDKIQNKRFSQNDNIT